VNAAAHQIIHHIIARGHRVKDITHHAALGFAANGAETKIDYPVMIITALIVLAVNIDAIFVAAILALVSHFNRCL